MNSYVTSTAIKTMREKKQMTQSELAQKLCVSDKTVSKWETGRGLPDISLLEPLANALGISMIELFSGERVINSNRCANIARSQFYVCPLCGNVVHTMGKSVISCCGITLPPLESEECDSAHKFEVARVEDEYHVRLDHQMSKDHYISFLALITTDRVEIVKLYPEGNAEARFPVRGAGTLYAYCNKDGLFSMKITPKM